MFPVAFSSPFASRFDRVFDHGPGAVLNQLLRELDQTGFRRSASVPVTVWSDAETTTVVAEVPGITAADLQIEATNDTLTISGTRTSVAARHAEEKEAVLVQERPTATFRRTISLPWRIDADHVDARLEHGILTVVLRRTEADKPRRITVAA